MKHFNNINSLDELDRAYDLLIKENPAAIEIMDEYEERKEKIKEIKGAFSEAASTKIEEYELLMEDFFTVIDPEFELFHIAQSHFKKLKEPSKEFEIIYQTGKVQRISLFPDEGIDIEDGVIEYTTTRYGLTGLFSNTYYDEIVRYLNDEEPLELEGRTKDLTVTRYSKRWNCRVRYKIKYKWKR